MENETTISQAIEPTNLDNSSANETSTNYQVETQKPSGINEGQSAKDPDLILGKFKSVEDLSKAYEALQRQQGICSEELGSLRKNAFAFNQAQKNLETLQKYQNGFETVIKRDLEKYNSPEYFQNQTFKEIYKEAFQALGENLDTDKFIQLLEGYVSSRIFAHDKLKSANEETQKVLKSMDYKENAKSSFNPPQKRFDEMSEKEIDEMLDKLI
jgi:cysteinyl-tRNA synthetase